MPLREFVSAGGELIIHAAAHLKNSPTPELNQRQTKDALFPYSHIAVVINVFHLTDFLTGKK
jgi:hypothetical protein